MSMQSRGSSGGVCRITGHADRIDHRSGFPVVISERPTTLVELLRRRARDQTEREAYTFLEGEGVEESSLTYGELDRRARAVSGYLRASGISEVERALLLYPPGLDYIVAFFGCLYAGGDRRAGVPAPAQPAHARSPIDRRGRQGVGGAHHDARHVEHGPQARLYPGTRASMLAEHRPPRHRPGRGVARARGGRRVVGFSPIHLRFRGSA